MESDKEDAQFARETLQSFFHPNGPLHILIELARYLSFHSLWLLVVAGVISPEDVEKLLLLKPRMPEIATYYSYCYPRNIPLKHRIALLYDCGRYCPPATVADARRRFENHHSTIIIRDSPWAGLIPMRVFVSLLDPQDVGLDDLQWRPPRTEEEKEEALKSRNVFGTSDWAVIRDTIPYLNDAGCIRLGLQLQKYGRDEVARLVRSALHTKKIDPHRLFGYFTYICSEHDLELFTELWGMVRDKRVFFSKSVALGYTPQQCLAPPLSARTSLRSLKENDILYIACDNYRPDGGVEMVKYLLDNVCPPGRFYELQLYPLRVACSTGNEPLVRYLMNRFVSSKDAIAQWGSTARRYLEDNWPRPPKREVACVQETQLHLIRWCDYSDTWDGMRYPLDSITGADPSPDVVDAAIAELAAAR